MNSLMPTPTPNAEPTIPARPILVVDDDRKIVALVRAYLEREGFTVIAAHDGREALRQARAEDPALIVLDLMLPEVDGYEVMRLLRADSQVPVLMLTARSSLPERIIGLERGADDYLPKPFSPAELVVRVKAVLRRAGGPASSACWPRTTCASTRSATRSAATAA
jgi:DNA-binding response OmpR family regulator